MTGFNTQPPEGGWLFHHMSSQHKKQFQHTAARRRLGCRSCNPCFFRYGFNTQPPEGGWVKSLCHYALIQLFQHTAARRRLAGLDRVSDWEWLFQHTAARRRLDAAPYGKQVAKLVSTHSRPKAAGHNMTADVLDSKVSTHSRPKAAGRESRDC